MDRPASSTRQKSGGFSKPFARLRTAGRFVPDLELQVEFKFAAAGYRLDTDNTHTRLLQEIILCWACRCAWTPSDPIPTATSSSPREYIP